MNITFIGVGAIGLPMAQQIQQAGHTLIGVELSPENRNKAESVGIKTTANINEVKSNIVVVMVATPDQLHSVVQSAQNVANQYWIIMSTVGPDAVKKANEKLAQSGAKVIDCPVTGGTARARTGELMLFASGEKSHIDYVSAVLSAMGDIHHVGGNIGDGQAVKVVNQHLCSVHILAAAEALNLASTLGLDPSKVLKLVEKGAGGSWMLSDRGPRMLQGTDVEVTSTIGIFLKDSQLVYDAAQNSGAITPLLDIANAHYRLATEMGLTLKDDSRVIETLQS